MAKKPLTRTGLDLQRVHDRLSDAQNALNEIVGVNDNLSELIAQIAIAIKTATTAASVAIEAAS